MPSTGTSKRRVARCSDWHPEEISEQEAEEDEGDHDLEGVGDGWFVDLAESAFDESCDDQEGCSADQ